MSDMFTSIRQLALRNLSETVSSSVDSSADAAKRTDEAARATGFAIPELQRLVDQFYGEVKRLSLDLYEEALLDRPAVDNALSWLAENLGATARSGSLLRDTKSASTHEALIRTWYQQAQTRSCENETHAI